MEAVSADIEAVVALGKAWGMSESEISDCILKTVRTEDRLKTAPQSSPSYGLWWILSWIVLLIKVLVLCVVLIVLLYYGMNAVDDISPELQLKIQGIVSPYVFPVMRWSRKLFKPVVDGLGLYGLYSSECIIQNPFYVEEVPDCDPCQDMNVLIDGSKSTGEELMDYMDNITPFKLVQHSVNPPTYEDIQKMYHQNDAKFQYGSHSTLTNLPNRPNMTTVLNMSEEQLKNSLHGAIRVFWQSNGVPTAQAVRRLFPRPWFIPDSAEVSLEKSLIISGPTSTPFEMAQESFALVWYQQVQGSRKISLYPHPDCLSQCGKLDATLHPGDLVFYQDQYYRLETRPDSAEYKDELSIGFIGSFTF